MSLYNMLHGVESNSTELLKIIGIMEDEIPRYRDCYLGLDEYDDELCIIIHTRTGGGNREEFEAENEDLENNPNYKRNCDDDFDCTYANFYYKIPNEFKVILEKTHEENPSLTPKEKWELTFKLLDKKIGEGCI